MKNIKGDLRVPALVKDKRTQRGELLKEACALVNRGRKEKGFKLVSIARMAFMLQGVPNDDLYVTLKECKGAKTPGALFQYKLKTYEAQSKRSS